MTKRHSDAPYLIVRDTSVDRAMKIAKALNKELNIEIEVESIYAFLPRKGMRFKKRKRKPEKRTMCIDGINKCIPRGAECAGCGG
jgi:hypothetical protein